MTFEDLVRAIVREELGKGVPVAGVVLGPKGTDTPVAAVAPRGRGRPRKEEAAPVAAADPFETPAAPVAPSATLEDVRAALTALRAATSQDNALAVLKPFAANLTALKPELYGLVVGAAKGAMPTQKAAEVEADPFETPAAAPAKALTLEDVKAAVVAAQKRTGVDTVQAVVMKHGGTAASPDGGAMMPSLKALPPSAFAATVAELQALPSTK